MAIDVNLGLSAAATGTVDVITATYSPAPTLVDRKILFLRTAGTNTTTTPTFNPNGLGAKTIVKQGGAALVAGDLVGDAILMYNATSTQWELLNPRVRDLGTTTGTVADGLSLATFMAIPKVCMTAFMNLASTTTAATRMMFQYSGSTPVLTTGNAIAINPTTYSIVSTDYPTINGVTPKFRLRATIGVNNTAPSVNISFGLFPLTTPASSGGNNVKSWTIGSEVVSSTITQNTPAANTQYELVSSTFGLPANGLYAICITNSGSTAASSYVQTSATLETFY